MEPQLEIPDNIFLWSSSATPTDALRWRVNYRDALKMATQDILPNRPGRSFEREACHDDQSPTNSKTKTKNVGSRTRFVK